MRCRYSAVVFAMTIFSVVLSSWSQYRERKKLAELAHYVTDIDVLRNGERVTVRMPPPDSCDLS